ncbi:MAG: alpha/beta fold hydrolase [Acidobacteria bacterium]|nr:alpha/beta fold hydrolase [Acidobacteriota bacterium]
MSAPMQAMIVDGRSVAFLEGGDATASRVVVLVHAFPAGVRQLAPQLAAWPGWRLIAPALPGFDGSARLETPTVDAYARHVLALLDGLRVERAVFGGVSMGGYLTFAVLRQAAGRVAGLVLADTRSAADTPEALAGRRALLQTVERSGPDGVAAEMVPKLLGETTLGRRPDVVAHVSELIRHQPAGGIADAIHVLMSRPDSTPLLGGIRVPALVVVGDEDRLTPPPEMEHLARALPRSRFVRLPAAGHLANVENPDAFNAAVGEFLSHIQ